MLTEEGLERLRLAEAFGLNAFYQEQVGNIIIPEWAFTDRIRTRVGAFLRNNEDWVMGYENPDGECGIWWLNTREDAIL